MPQLFPKRANPLIRWAIVLVVLGIGGIGYVTYAIWRSPYMTRQRVIVDQPVPFSHEHHAGGLGIDCRYCHTGVETSSSAGLPPTDTCMTCHSQLYTDAAMLEPVRRSQRLNRPIEWNRVHDLPDFAYFNHSIHIAKGVACVECHGRVDKMPLTYQSASLYMKWCLDCHKNPEPRLRPREQVFAMDAPKATAAEAKQLLELYNIHPKQMTDCSVCHR